MLRALFRWIFPRSGDPSESSAGRFPNVPPAKVAVVGAGVGGCFSASFLRELGGGTLEIHVYSDGPVGGRTATLDVDGHLYESGGSLIHTSNKYLVDMAKRYGLKTQRSETRPTAPLGIFDGKMFVLRTGTCSMWNTIKVLLRYGLSLVQMMLCVKTTVKKFAGIYQLQSEGRSFATMPDLLRAAGGDPLYQTTQVSAQEFCTQRGWSTKLADEIISGGLRNNYGQGLSVNAFTMLVSMAGAEDGSLWKVIGGNKLIPINALQSSGAVFHDARVTQITRRVCEGGCVKYILDFKEQGSPVTLTQEFDAVIVAFPLNSPDPHGVLMPWVQFEGFSTPVYTPPACTPYHNTVATFVKGEINPVLFGCTGLENNFPLFILTTENYSGIADFNSVEVQVPCDIPEKDVVNYLKPLKQEPVRLWKVFTSDHPLTEEQKRALFKSYSASVSVAVNWMAYPQYKPPEGFPSFILDDGVFYVNAVEKAASAMEMSAIGAKNAALLTMEHLMKKSHHA